MNHESPRLIKEQELTTSRPMDGIIEAVSVVQQEDSSWQMEIRASWRAGELCLVGQFHGGLPKSYKRLGAALRHIVLEYGYSDAIEVRPYPGVSHPKSF